MRPLTSEELEMLFKKLSHFIGQNVSKLIEDDDNAFVFRLHRDRVYYMSENVLKMAGNIPRKQLISAGVCMGKFTKAKKFRLMVTALDYLALHSKHKVWLKSAGEQSFLYGNNVIKRHLAKISENTPRNSGVVFFSESEVPLGFGVTAKDPVELRSCNTEAIIAFHQADTGEYLRDEADLV